MAALVAPGICRYAINGSYAGRAVVNILDMKIDTTGSTISRDEAIEAQAELIIDGWTVQVLDYLVVDNYSANELTWVDLDSLTGSTGAKSSTAVSNWPDNGLGAQEPMPGNVALRVNKRTNAARGERQGRMYLCGVAENQTDNANPNALSSAFVTGGNERLADLLTDITKETVGPSDWSSQLHVVHTVGGVFQSSSEVVLLEIDGTLGSQRRRLRG